MKPGSSRLFLLLILSFFLSLPLIQAQESSLSIHTREKQLSVLLEELSQRYSYKFAYDADHFSTLLTNIDLDQVSIDQFLTRVCTLHSLGYKLINGTYVLFPAAQQSTPVVQKVKIQGKVTDIATNEALAYSTIVFSKTGTITNDLGHFSFLHAPGSPVQISIFHLGYHRLDTLIQPGQTAFLNLNLKPMARELAQINIQAREKNMLEVSPRHDAIAFNPKQTANIPRIDENDMVNALTLIPGINFLGGSYSGLSIRGGAPSENLVTIDGIPVLETNHLFGNVSSLNAKFVKEAFVSRGGFDVSHGDRVSGIVEMTGKTGKRSNPEADLSANLINGNAFAAVPLGEKVSLSGAYSQSYIDRWQNYLFHRLHHISAPGDASTTEEDGISLTPMVNYRDGNAKVAIRPNKHQEITLNMLYSDESMERDFVFENENSFKLENADGKSWGTGLNWSFQSKSWLNKFSVSLTGLERNSLLEAGRTVEVIKPGKKKKKTVRQTQYEMESDHNEVEEQKLSWQSEISHSIFSHKFGAGWVSDNISYSFKAQESTNTIPIDSLNEHRKSMVYHAYYQQQLTPWKPLKVRAGFRADYSEQTGKVILQPRGGVYLSPMEDLQFYYLAGKYAQYLSQIRKIDIYGNFDLVWYLPDPTSQGLLTSIHQVAGGRYEKGKLLLNLELYKKATEGKMNLFASLYNKGNVTRIDYKAYPGNEINQGLDVFVQYQDARWTQMLAYTLSRSKERYEGYNMGEYFPAFNDQRHRLRLVEMLRINSWIASASWTFNTGYPTPVSPVGMETMQFERLNNFSQLDFGLVKRFRYKHFALDAGASLLNVLNHKNIVERDFFSLTDATGTSTLNSELTAISFTPVFYINIRLD
ncbi:MAG TPA: TonB-dependent receptor [Prolixibacteraceae bacterium]|nr:TonB-dependent receptor [Prolixibacteraceae bacterium]